MIDPGPAAQTMGPFKGRRNAQGRYVALAGPAGTPAASPISIASVVDNGDGTLTISGEGFGTKGRDAPILHDLVDTAWVLGDERVPYADVNDGDPIPAVTWTDPDGIISRAESKKGEETAHYYGNADRGGGLVASAAVRADLPVQQGSTLEAYGGVWMRTPSHPQKVVIAGVTGQDLSGFIFENTADSNKARGEEILVNGYTGRLDGVYTQDDTQFVEIRFDEYIKNSFGDKLGGHTVTGQTSGATFQMPEEFRGGIDSFPRFKNFRVWDSAGDNGTTGRLTFGREVSMLNNPAGDSDENVFLENYKEGEWNHVEYEVFFSENTPEDSYLVGYINGVEYGRGPSTDRPYVKDKGPLLPTSIGLPGDARPKTNVCEIAEIYCDDSRNRVVISEQPSISKGVDTQPPGKREVQRILSWSDTEIVVAKNNTSGVPSPRLYVHTGGENNEIGFDLSEVLQ